MRITCALYILHNTQQSSLIRNDPSGTDRTPSEYADVQRNNTTTGAKTPKFSNANRSQLFIVAQLISASSSAAIFPAFVALWIYATVVVPRERGATSSRALEAIRRGVTCAFFLLPVHRGARLMGGSFSARRLNNSARHCDGEVCRAICGLLLRYFSRFLLAFEFDFCIARVLL